MIKAISTAIFLLSASICAAEDIDEATLNRCEIQLSDCYRACRSIEVPASVAIKFGSPLHKYLRRWRSWAIPAARCDEECNSGTCGISPKLSNSAFLWWRVDQAARNHKAAEASLLP
jgi:hypothetical protein